MRFADPGVHESTGVGVGLLGTVTVHLCAIGLLWAGVRPPAPSPPVYAVELVAAPAPAPDQKPAPEVVQRPPAETTAPTEPPKPAPKTAPKPPPPKTPPTAKRTEPTPRAAAPAAPLATEKPSTGSDIANVSTPGLAFPFPEYLHNIVQEVYRRWDRPSGNSALRAEVSFLVLRDGSVHEIKMSRTSGNFSFDLAAQGAIEAAGAAHAFGPLPDGYPADVLPVSFYFTPSPQ